MAETPDRYCGNCGHKLGPDDQFCRNCGTPVHQAATVPTPEADVPVPPPPQAGGAGGSDAAAAPPPQQFRQTGRWSAGRVLVLVIVAPVLLAIAWFVFQFTVGFINGLISGLFGV